MPKDQRIERLRWGCRRGMLELDVLLEQFFNNYFNKLSDIQQVKFEKLLNCHDQDLFAWFIGSKDPEDDDLMEMVELIRQHGKKSHS